ncbi:unnamed protein product [Lota lota]
MLARPIKTPETRALMRRGRALSHDDVNSVNYVWAAARARLQPLNGNICPPMKTDGISGGWRGLYSAVPWGPLLGGRRDRWGRKHASGDVSGLFKGKAGGGDEALSGEREHAQTPGSVAPTGRWESRTSKPQRAPHTSGVHGALKCSSYWVSFIRPAPVRGPSGLLAKAQGARGDSPIPAGLTLVP